MKNMSVMKGEKMTGILKRRGRPRVGTGKDGRWEVRTSPKDDAMMEYLIEKRGKTKTEIILEAVRSQYNFELSKGN